jgi:hypothetical protein
MHVTAKFCWTCTTEGADRGALWLGDAEALMKVAGRLHHIHRHVNTEQAAGGGI